MGLRALSVWIFESDDSRHESSGREGAAGGEYVHADAGALERLGDFDIVTGIHLLHYANSREHLNGMCKSISRNLKPAGRFIGYQLNFDIARKPHYYYKDRFNSRISEQTRDG